MREFETVVDQLVRVGEQLSDLAVAEVVQKKLLVELEQTAEVRRLAAALAARQTPDFEAWESLMLQAARQGGAGVLGTLLTHWQQHAPREVLLCKCGQRMTSRGRKSKQLLTTLGQVPFGRSFYQCEQCHHSRFPDDERLDIVQTSYSPGVRRLMARAGSLTQFEQASEDLLCYAGLKIEAREIERVAEDVGREVEQWLSEQQCQTLQRVGMLAAPSGPLPKLYVSSDAVHIVDLFHAYEHLTAIAQTLWGQEAKAPKAWRDLLEAGDISALLRKAGQQLPASAKSKKSMLKQLGYFENNASQMRYAEYREKKFFVGSGVVEAGCRTVIGERLKQSGMRWSVRGANAIIALRCCLLSGRFEDFWASRNS